MTNLRNIPSADSAEHNNPDRKATPLEYTRMQVIAGKANKFSHRKIGTFSWLFLNFFEISLAIIFWRMSSIDPELSAQYLTKIEPQFYLFVGLAIATSLLAFAASGLLKKRRITADNLQKIKAVTVFAAYFPLCWALGLLLSTGSSTIIGAVTVILFCVTTIMLLSSIGKTYVILAELAATLFGLGLGFDNIGYWIASGVAVAVLCAWMPIQARKAAILKNEHRQQNRAMNRASAILTDFENTGNGWFWETDRQNRITYLSERTAKVLDRDIADLIGKPVSVLIDASQQRDENQERTLNFHLTTRAPFKELNVRVATEEEDRWWSISGRPIFDIYNNFQGFRGSGTDLTEMRKSQAEVSRLAHYDSLTGLSNRLHMQTTLERILAAPNPPARACALFLLDLDRFKEVNDTMGHPAGDSLLRQVSKRLQRIIGDGGHVGRLGGDEFQLILPNKISKQQLGPLAEQIIKSISEPYMIDSSAVTIGVSIGIAIAPHDGVTNEALVRNADLALYAAKGRGRGVHHFYAPDLHSDAEDRRQLEADLREALINGGLEVVYQPVVETKSEKITGVEALLRWNHPTRGPVSPERFIPIAEDAGIIGPIGEWTLRTAVDAVSKWPGHIRVAVNVSPIQFANPSFPGVVANALANSGLLPERLELEITESVFLNDDTTTDNMFQALKALGVRLALDDFGTGYSSLGYLKKAPFDKIKIDQSFVRGATQKGSRNGAIIRSIVSLAEALKMDTTAEGVETHDELDLIRKLGCSHIQGYIYSKPVSAEAMVHMLQASTSEVAPQGHNTGREPRRKMFRVVNLIHNKQLYQARIRDSSSSGVLVEGLRNVPVGTEFLFDNGDGTMTRAECRWSKDDKMGLALTDQISSVDQADASQIIQHIPFAAPKKAASN
jgi:diguanylate cyclase (GGDEF)-like protein/PAS domain S-box-containing protein